MLKPGAIYCEFADGQQLVMPYSVSRLYRGLVHERILSAAGTYGGALYGPGVTQKHLLKAIHSLSWRHSLTWRLNPYEPHAGLLAEALQKYATTRPGLWTWREDSSEVLDLEILRPKGELLEHVRYSCRKQIRKGERAGIAVRQAITTAEWDAFITLYRQSIERWGKQATVSYPDSLFRALQTLSHETCRLWLAYHEGRLVGGSVNFYHNRHTVEWLAAYNPASFALGVRNLLTAQMIKQAITEGFGIYDFNPSGTLEGTRRFKQTFSTCQKPSPVAVRRTVLHCVLERIRQ